MGKMFKLAWKYIKGYKKNTRKISDTRVEQFYESSDAFDMGKTLLEYDEMVLK